MLDYAPNKAGQAAPRPSESSSTQPSLLAKLPNLLSRLVTLKIVLANAHGNLNGFEEGNAAQPARSSYHAHQYIDEISEVLFDIESYAKRIYDAVGEQAPSPVR